MKSKYIKTALSIMLSLLVLILNPLSLSTLQNLLFAVICLSILLWATELVDRTLVSAILLIVFVVMSGKSGVSMERIFSFPLSSNFITIVSSFLLSAGVVNCGIAKKLADHILKKYCRNLIHLVIAACLLNALLAMVIPHPVPRITLLGSVYYVMLKDQQLNENQRKAVLFSVFVTATTTAMLMKNCDVVLNAGTLSIGGVDLSQAQWICYMTLPTIAASALLVGVYILFHKRFLNAPVVMDRPDSVPLSRQGKLTSILMISVVILWVTESIHGIAQSHVSLGAVVLMFLLGALKLLDLRAINLPLLLFLTAEFALGNVLTDSGIAASISDILLRIMPTSDSVYLPLLLLTLSIYILHTLFGGAMGALAVSLPIVTVLWDSVLKPEVIALTALVLVTCHYVFPYNQMTILVGYGQKYYTFKDVMRFALVLTPLVAFMVFGIYLPWWKLTGLL